MTLEEFNACTDDERADAVWQGTFLADRASGDRHLQLYSLANFYVEVVYDQQANRISALRAFREKESLVPYLAQIKFNLR